MLAALASAQAARDPSTAAHCTRVTDLATRLAAWMGWGAARLDRLRVGARLHDIGKVMISERILSKRGPLSPAELAEIRLHPSAGVRLIAPVDPAHARSPISSTTTSGGTAPAIRLRRAATMSPKARDSSPSSTHSTR